MKLFLHTSIAILFAGSVGAQNTQVLHSNNFQTGSRFGRGVGVSGDTLAVGSGQSAGSPSESGRLSIFRRSAGGQWVLSQEFGRNPAFTDTSWYTSSRFGTGATIVDDSMMVESNRGRHCFEFVKGPDDLWHPHVAIGPVQPVGVDIGGSSDSAYDGETLVMGFPQAGNLPNQPDPNLYFFERRGGNWTMVRRFTALGIGLTGTDEGKHLGRAVAVCGDYAACATPRAREGGVQDVGLVATFRRVAGVWEFDRILRRPGSPTHNHWYGTEVAMDENWLFVTCTWDDGRIPCIYVYRNDPQAGWVLDSRIHVTPSGSNPATHLGFGMNLRWVPPTLAVSAPAYRLPVQPGQPDVGGEGAILLFERCTDGIWNQRFGLHAPADLGAAGGIGADNDSMDFDGKTLVGGSPDTFEFNWQVGMVAVAPAPQRVITECDEIGRPACTPAALETQDCPCGATAEPGRGCPNGVGPGARLVAHGSFDERTIRRVRIEDLPPHSLVLLHIGDGIPNVLPAGQVAGDGILCVTPTVAQRVGISDGAGQLLFDEVQVRPPLPLLHYSLFGYQQPIQAVYRSPQSGPCHSGWNATNALTLMISTLGPPL